jgi:hypothetical protein
MDNMSGKVSGWVWDLDLPQNQKFILLAYADHADHEGKHVFPAVDLICKKTGYSRRSVQNITKALRLRGLLVPEGGQAGGRGISAHWSIPIKGANPAPIKTERAYPDTERAQNETKRAQPGALKGAAAIAPEPSLPVIKEEPSLTLKEYCVFTTFWNKHFPEKQITKRNKTIPKLFEIRIKDKAFLKGYKRGIINAAASDFIENDFNGFNAGWFLRVTKGDPHWERCERGDYENGSQGGNGRGGMTVQQGVRLTSARES